MWQLLTLLPDIAFIPHIYGGINPRRPGCLNNLIDYFSKSSEYRNVRNMTLIKAHRNSCRFQKGHDELVIPRAWLTPKLLEASLPSRAVQRWEGDGAVFLLFRRRGHTVWCWCSFTWSRARPKRPLGQLWVGNALLILLWGYPLCSNPTISLVCTLFVMLVLLWFMGSCPDPPWWLLEAGSHLSVSHPYPSAAVFGLQGLQAAQHPGPCVFRSVSTGRLCIGTCAVQCGARALKRESP